MNEQPKNQQPAAAPINDELAAFQRATGCQTAKELLDKVIAEKAKQPAPSPADERAVHALDCQYILDDNPWAICTCGKGSPNNPRAASANEMGAEGAFIDIVFDGPPSRESGRFVEVEDTQGRSFNAGEWIDRGNGLWALRIARSPAQADARGGLTRHEISEAIRNVIDFPDLKNGEKSLLEELTGLLAAHPCQPEPRDEVTDDKLDAERYRLLKSIPFGPGVPPVYRGIAFSFAVSTGKPGFIRSCRGEEMDAAIDAARTGAAHE